MPATKPDSSAHPEAPRPAATIPLAAFGGDAETTLLQLRQLMADFVRERNWEQFHAPKNLAMSIAIEAAELMEHFQWIDVEASRRPDRTAAIGDELADVVCYCLALANSLQLDLATLVYHKMERNRQKYPVDRFRGRWGEADVRTTDEGSHVTTER